MGIRRSADGDGGDTGSAMKKAIPYWHHGLAEPIIQKGQ